MDKPIYCIVCRMPRAFVLDETDQFSVNYMICYKCPICGHKTWYPIRQVDAVSNK